jgi:hypothetical protein
MHDNEPPRFKQRATSRFSHASTAWCLRTQCCGQNTRDPQKKAATPCCPQKNSCSNITATSASLAVLFLGRRRLGRTVSRPSRRVGPRSRRSRGSPSPQGTTRAALTAQQN